MSTTQRRRAIATVLVAALALGLGACGKKAPRTNDPAETGSGGFGQVAGGTPTTPAPPVSTPRPAPTSAAPPAGPTYPGTAKDYAAALLAAWGDDDVTRVAQLANPAAEQQVKDNGSADPHWQYVRCDGTAGSTYCVFRNDHGDEVQVRIRNEAVGKPDAVSEALLRRTTYPKDAGSYVGAFVDAWQHGNVQRVKQLANDRVAGALAALTAPTGYTLLAPLLQSLLWLVTLQPLPLGSGQNLLFRVVKDRLGEPHAIQELGTG